MNISIKEYKELRNTLDSYMQEYYLMLVKYNQLANEYNKLVSNLQPEEPKQKTIGFKEGN